MKLCELMADVTIQGDVRLSVWDEDCNEVAVSEIMGITDSLSEYNLKKAKRTVTFYGDNKKIPSVLKWAEYEITYIFCPGDGFLHIELKAKEA